MQIIIGRGEDPERRTSPYHVQYINREVYVFAKYVRDGRCLYTKLSKNPPLLVCYIYIYMYDKDGVTFVYITYFGDTTKYNTWYNVLRIFYYTDTYKLLLQYFSMKYTFGVLQRISSEFRQC